MSNKDLPIECQLVSNGTLFEEFQILDSKIGPTLGNDDRHVAIRFHVDEDLGVMRAVEAS